RAVSAGMGARGDIRRDITHLLDRQGQRAETIAEHHLWGLHKDSCKSGHWTQREVLPHIIRAVFGGIILPMARLIRAVGHDPIGEGYLSAEFCRLNLLPPMRCFHSCHSPNTTPLQRSLRLWPFLHESLCNPLLGLLKLSL